MWEDVNRSDCTDGGPGPVWGHAYSRDMVTWEPLPPALWNDQWYDRCAVYTGSATMLTDGPVIMYPGICQQDDHTHNCSTGPSPFAHFSSSSFLVVVVVLFLGGTGYFRLPLSYLARIVMDRVFRAMVFANIVLIRARIGMSLSLISFLVPHRYKPEFGGALGPTRSAAHQLVEGPLQPCG